MNFNIYLFSLLNIFVFILSKQIWKSLTPLVRMGCYLLSVIFIYDWVSIAGNSANIMELPVDWNVSILFIVNRLVLLPLTVVLFLELFLQRQNKSTQIVTWLVGVAVVACLDYSNSWLEIIHYQHWNITRALFLWLCFSIFFYGGYRFFGYLEKKGS